MPHSKLMNNCNTHAELSHSTKVFFATLYALTMSAMINSPTSAIPPTETIKLLAPDGAANDEFGNAVALSNLAGLSEANANIALVGVQFDSIGIGSSSFERAKVNCSVARALPLRVHDATRAVGGEVAAVVEHEEIEVGQAAGGGQLGDA